MKTTTTIQQIADLKESLKDNREQHQQEERIIKRKLNALNLERLNEILEDIEKNYNMGLITSKEMLLQKIEIMKVTASSDLYDIKEL